MRQLTPRVILAFGVLTCASAARAACTDGDARLEAGDPAGAIALYEAAIARPACAEAVPLLRVNLAYAREQRARATDRPADYCAAQRAYTEALADATPSAAAAMKPSLDTMTARCVRPAQVMVRCERGATVEIEGLGAPRPCPALFTDVAPGDYTGRAVAASSAEVALRFTARPGETTEVAVALPSAAAITDDPPVPEAGAALTPYAWVSAGLAAVSAGVAIYATLDAARLADDAAALNAEIDAANSAWHTGDQSPSDWDASRAEFARITARQSSLRSDHQSAGRLATGAWVATGVFAAGAIALWVLDDPAPTARPSVEVAPAGVLVRF